MLLVLIQSVQTDLNEILKKMYSVEEEKNKIGYVNLKLKILDDWI